MLNKIPKPRPVIGWKPDVRLPLLVEVPEGLERPCSRSLIKDGWPETEQAAPGLLQFSNLVETSRLSVLPRYAYGWRIALARAELEATAAGFAALLAQVTPLWRDWLDMGEAETLPYRFSVTGRKLARHELPEWLTLCRATFAPLGLTDEPAAYVAEIVVSFAGKTGAIYFRPTFQADERFAYRKQDVGASMNPVVAAALARLLPSPLGGRVIDATSGSGTLLVERCRADPTAIPAGFDISPVALKASRGNLLAAGLDGSGLKQGDAADPSLWSPCKAVIANLPFGLRTGRADADLPGLYKKIVVNAARFLEPGGRVLLATTQLKTLDDAIRGSQKLKILARHRVQSGGLWVHVVVLGSNS